MPKTLKKLPKPELVIGLIAKIGTDIEKINVSIAEVLREYDYQVVRVKVTDAVKQSSIQRIISSPIVSEPIEKRYSSSMDACNKLRSKLGNEVMAEVAISNISAVRESKQHKSEASTAYVIRQLKRKEEVDLLRQVYGDRFILMSCYSPRDTRCTELSKTIASGHSSQEPETKRHLAESLISRDEIESGNSHGQGVRNAFPLADVIIDSSQSRNIKKGLVDFFKVFFGDPTISPKNSEYGSYMAASAALRSTDLSRQVGAAIFTENCEIISLGCNEVPKYTGGTYMHDQATESGVDGRDAALGFDENAKMKSEIVKDAILKISNVLGEKRTSDEVDKLLQKHLYSKKAQLEDLLIMDITEFGRAVHAEMNAITDAARLGRSTKGATLYCTTYPCHNCAKHIVASGITRVVYIQPYPKSKAIRLYPDSIVTDPTDAISGKVVFETHKGVAPNLYKRVFGKAKQKDEFGNLIPWQKNTALPCVNQNDIGYLNNELVALNKFNIKMRNKTKIPKKN